MSTDLFKQFFKQPVGALINAARPYYDTNAELRKYHNWSHAFNVVAACYELTDAPSDVLILAAVWHDAVYFPGAGEDANERCSAAALIIEARKLHSKNRFSAHEMDAINHAQLLVQYTSVSHHFRMDMDGIARGDHAIILDADLSSLADPYEQFVQNQHNIIDENDKEIDSETCRDSAVFLFNLLQCRKHLYHTDKGRELWEDKARSNIQQWCTENGLDWSSWSEKQ